MKMSDHQAECARWAVETFGHDVVADTVERRHRFVEEALELLQALGGTRDEALQLVDYVFGRPIGEPAQEVGGVMTTLAVLCHTAGIDLAASARRELWRCWANQARIRAKQAAKPKHSVLPGPAVQP